MNHNCVPVVIGVDEADREGRFQRASPLVYAADRARYYDILRRVGLPGE
jgi:hypothetical protein